MNGTKKVVALGLASAMCVSVLTACKSNTPSGGKDGTLVIGEGNFDGKFSPFFAISAYDRDVLDLVQLSLATVDREGSVVLKGIEGEKREYNGTEYTYNGISDINITENDDGSVYYDITLKDGVKFSDGTVMDIDDVIFTMYVLSDPTYDGATTLYGQPILGMQEYRSGIDTKFNLIVKAGKDNTDFSKWTKEEQDALWADLKQAGAKFAQEIVDYCVKAGKAADANDVATAAEAYGFPGLAADATVDDFFLAMAEKYKGDFSALSTTESAGTPLFDFMEKYGEYNVGIQTGESAPNIKGIQKTGENSMRVTTTEVSATAIYQIAVTVAPLHYYGDESQYNYENNQFGFPKGDLSKIREKSSAPMGAGPYKFVSYENGTVALDANENYWKGEPKIKHISLKETADADKISGVASGTLDITDPAFSTDAINEIASANGGSKDFNGSKITVNTVDNLGYGYVGINADNVRVGNESGSEASKNLRKGLATVLAVYRDVAVDSYFGEQANIINYPISDTSWAAPRVTDAGYQIAFSTDVEGKPIYTEGMTDSEKYAAAKEAALGFFEGAGYTVSGGKVTAAPKGASTEYEMILGGSGKGDHPTFLMASEASKALKEIGINLIVTDLASAADLFAQMNAGTAELFAAAWQATPDPDMFQIYHSQGTSNYNYDIKDPKLDELIVEARSTTDQNVRVPIYKDALDIVMDWGVEIPVYQRKNCFIFSSERVNIGTLTPDMTTYWDWMNDIEKLELKG